MDFLITNKKINIVNSEKCFKYRSDRRVKDYVKIVTNNYQSLFFGNTFSKYDKDQAAFWDGQFSIDRVFYHPSLKNEVPINLIKKLAAGNHIANGVFCAVELNLKHESFKLSIDSLSQYPIYIFQNNSEYIVSNNSKMVAILADGLEKSALASIENCVYGGVYSSSHYDQIFKLKFGQSIIANNKLKIIELGNNFDTANIDDAINNAHHSISNHMNAVLDTTSNMNIISDITGGIDTRLILSYLLRGGNNSSITGRCMGEYPSPDANVAGSIMEKFNIHPANFPILNSRLEETLRASAGLAGGSIQADVAMESVAIKNFVHFSGDFGGIAGLTGFNAYDFLSSQGMYSFNNHANILAERRKKAGIIGLVKDDALDVVKASYSKFLQNLHSKGIKSEDLTQEAYLQIRSSNHFGMQSFVRNRTKILPSPLANRWLVSCRRLMDRKSTYNRTLFFNLIERNNRELLWMPLANKKWSKDISCNYDKNYFENMDIIDINSSNLSGYKRSLFEKVVVPDKRYYREISKKVATNSVKSQIHTAKLSVYQGLCKLFLSEFSINHNMWEFWNRKMVEEYSKREISDFRADGLDIEVMGLFITSAIWLTDLEIWRGIESNFTLS